MKKRSPKTAKKSLELVNDSIPLCKRQPLQGQYSNWPEEAVSLEPKTRYFLEAKRQWKKKQPGSANEYGR